MNQPHKLAASVRQRLKNRSTAQKEDFQAILTRYALERFLYRLSQSPPIRSLRPQRCFVIFHLESTTSPSHARYGSAWIWR